MQNNKGFSAVVVLLAIIAITLVGFTGWYVWASNKENDVTSYEQCALEKDAVIQESYPEVCFYKDKRFVNPNQKVEAEPPQPTEKNEQSYLEITEWGVKIPLSDEIKDAELGEFTYETVLSADSPTVDIVFLSTTSAPEGCKLEDTEGRGIGALVRSKELINSDATDKKIDGYYYSFYGGQDGTCGTPNDNLEEATAKKSSLVEPYVKAIKNIESL